MDQPKTVRSDRNFSADQIREIRHLLSLGVPRTKIARDNGVSSFTIRCIDLGLTYAWVKDAT